MFSVIFAILLILTFLNTVNIIFRIKDAEDQYLKDREELFKKISILFDNCIYKPEYEHHMNSILDDIDRSNEDLSRCSNLIYDYLKTMPTKIDLSCLHNKIEEEIKSKDKRDPFKSMRIAFSKGNEQDGE